MVIDRLRRSLRGLGGNRDSKDKDAENDAHRAKHQDELTVRSGNECSFPVKYLGSIEVREARGVDVCERALEQLRRRASTGGHLSSNNSIVSTQLDANNNIEKQSPILTTKTTTTTTKAQTKSTLATTTITEVESQLTMDAICVNAKNIERLVSIGDQSNARHTSQVHNRTQLTSPSLPFHSLGTGTCRVSGVLHITSDGLRFVVSPSDGNERQLLVDQTLDRVSFCAPDRRHSRAFAYICRDAASRRWICHGFHALAIGPHANERDQLGERVAHAIGCAFVVCHERKQQLELKIQQQQQARQQHQQSATAQCGGPLVATTPVVVVTTHNKHNADIIAPVTIEHSSSNVKPIIMNSNQQQQQQHLMFTRPPIAQRWADPQTCLRRIDAGPARSPACQTPNPYAIERPRASFAPDRLRQHVPDGRLLAAAMFKSRCAAA